MGGLARLERNDNWTHDELVEGTIRRQRTKTATIEYIGEEH